MWVKICATTTLEDAQLAADAGADAVGFVFAESKRRVSPQQVAAITAKLHGNAERVGVFHSHDLPEVIAAVRTAGLTAVQIHRGYSPQVISALRQELGPEIKLIQVVSCAIERPDEDRLKGELQAASRNPELWGILLDAAHGGASGGTGRQFNWMLVAKLLDEAWPERAEVSAPKLILAGGLRPENLQEAIATLRPSGVDVASGVERSPGVKEADRVRRFVKEART